MTTPDPLASMSPEELVAVVERGLAADEAAAKAWLPFGNPDDAARAHIARHDPGRVLADVEAKRDLLTEHHPEDGCCRTCMAEDREVLWDGETETVQWAPRPVAAPCPTLRALARPYLDQETP